MCSDGWGGDDDEYDTSVTCASAAVAEDGVGNRGVNGVAGGLNVVEGTRGNGLNVLWRRDLGRRSDEALDFVRLGAVAPCRLE